MKAIALTSIIMTILMAVGCSASNKCQIEKRWQNIIESQTEKEERTNVEYFHQECMRDISVNFEIKDKDGIIYLYNATKLSGLPENASVRLIAYKGDKEIGKTNFWKPKNNDNFYYLFNE